MIYSDILTLDKTLDVSIPAINDINYLVALATGADGFLIGSKNTSANVGYLIFSGVVYVQNQPTPCVLQYAYNNGYISAFVSSKSSYPSQVQGVRRIVALG